MGKIFASILASFRAVLLIIPMAVFIVVYLILTKTIVKHTKEKAFKLRRLYLRYANWVLGISTELEGTIPEGTSLFVSNHRSLSDPLILCQYLDAFIIAKAEVGQYPLISTGAELTGILYVQREDKNSRQAVREKLKSTLLSGSNVLVYPEGTVNYNKTTLPYRPGTFKEIVNHGISVVPIVLEYKHAKDVWFKSPMLNHFFKQFGRFRTRAKVVIGKPMFNEDGALLRQQIEEWTNSTIEDIHKNWPGSYFSTNNSIEKQISEK